VNQVRHHHNPPAASFTPPNESMNQMKTIPNIPRAGFTLLEIMIVVAIIGLLAAIAIPNFENARARAQANACINNLCKIDAVASEFALENGKKNGDAINYPSDLTPYIKLNRAGSIPGCPAGGTYSETTVGVPPNCSLGNTVNPPHLLP
jgi:prepilin-type N-terminal cleavage/methylation domain-containing protein